MKLSVIIPVYRVEDTIDKCIESVIGQDYYNMEIILVDDGSPDRCSAKCDEWAQKDDRIRVIHKENGGLSDARNAGLDIAAGDYITFVDSDDYIREDTYLPLMKIISGRPDIDILEYPIYVFFGSDKQYKLLFTDEKEYHNMDDYWYKGEAYLHSYACNKIYRSDLFKGIRYPKGIIFEDMHTLPRLLQQAKVIATTSQGLYYYCTNPSGITATADGNGLKMLLQTHVEIINKTQRNDGCFQRYYMHVLNIQMDVSELTGISPVLPQRHISTKHLIGKAKLKAFILNIMGINYICRLNKIIHKFIKTH